LGYALLGDDSVAQNYFKLLIRLDMPYSPQKTHESLHFYEFAKRVIYRSDEITGYSVGGLLSVYKSYPLLANFINNQESHGFVLTPEQFRVFFFALFKLLKSKRYSYEHSLRLFKLYSVFSELLISKVTGSYFNLFYRIKELFGYSLIKYDHEFLTNIVRISKKKLAEEDLRKVNQSHKVVFDNLNKMVSSYIRTWPDQDQYTVNFLWETVPAMLRNNSPLLASLDEVIELFSKACIESNFDSVESLGLAKYFIGKTVFSMKRSDSQVLSYSALTKIILNHCRDQRSGIFIKELYPNLEGNSIIYL
jgi:hypothetical protein